MARRLYELDNLYILVAATVKRALLDAKRGDQRAEYWLDELFPVWRKTSQQNGQISTKTNAGYIDAHQTNKR